MKGYLTIIWAIICLIVLFLGHSYWKHRTIVQADQQSVTASQSANAAVKKTAQEDDNSTLLKKAKNWPEAAQAQLKQAIKEKKPFKVLFVGSAAIGTADKGMAKEVSDKLTAAYGSSHIETSVLSYNLTTTVFVARQEQLKVAAEKAQLIILEPFILNDNGNVAMKDSLANIAKMIQDIKAADPGCTILLQPSFPLYAAKYYPGQVAQLKNFAQQNQLVYLNHWSAWPDTNNVQLKDYVLPDLGAPTDKGNEVWSQYLANYLIAQ